MEGALRDLGFSPFSSRQATATQGPGLALVIYKEASPRDPGATSHHPRDLLSSDVEFNIPPHHQPHNNNDDREMRTNCNAPPQKKNPVTNAGVDKAASCWSGLLPHSAVWCWVGENMDGGEG